MGMVAQSYHTSNVHVFMRTRVSNAHDYRALVQAMNLIKPMNVIKTPPFTNPRVLQCSEGGRFD